jgi:2-polyprenyl-3-methyl-5-hydroxy-6-metoxy-1,4-benzoquinol methylase
VLPKVICAAGFCLSETMIMPNALARFSQVVGLSPDVLLRTFEIENRYHASILAEENANARRILYAKLYKEVFEMYGAVFSIALNKPTPNKDRIVHLFSKELSKKKILDAGCGNGDFLISCARLLPVIALVGIDTFAENIEFSTPALRFMKADLTSFEIGEKFDVVMSDNVYEHLAPADGEAYLRSIYNTLSPSGKLIILTPQLLFGPWDVTRIHDDSYSGRTAAQGSHLNETTYTDLIYTLKSVGFRKFTSVLPVARISNRHNQTRIPASLYAWAERIPLLVRYLQQMEKASRLPAFEIAIVATHS